jgi:hypothetical protein
MNTVRWGQGRDGGYAARGRLVAALGGFDNRRPS